MENPSLNQLKLPPQNIEAEKSLLGCLLIDPMAIEKVGDFLRVEDFYNETHQKIHAAILDLYSRRAAIDILSVSNRLKEKKELEEIGGISYLSSLVNYIPTASHVLEYAKIVQEKKNS